MVSAAFKNYTNMRKTILLVLLGVFSISSFADFRIRVNAMQRDDDGWEEMDYSAPDATNYVYAVYKKVDPELSGEEKYSSITLSAYNKKTNKKESDVCWAYWRSTNLGSKFSGRDAQGRYYTCTRYKNTLFDDGTAGTFNTYNTVVYVYYYPSTKVYNIRIDLVDCNGRTLGTVWYKN